MERVNNYLIQAAQAKKRFLTYDQQKLIDKFSLDHDEKYFYVNLLCQQYRISRTTGHMDKRTADAWTDANTYDEVMTLLDLICDSRDDRRLSGRWTSAQMLGNMFHRSLLEQQDPLAERIDREPELFHRACRQMGSRELDGGDIGYAVELFDGLHIGMQFWHGDDEFPPKLHLMWDANALQYLRYETTYFAAGLLRQRIAELMVP